MAASIYGSQVQSAAQSLAAYLQALQAKSNSAATTNGAAAGNVAAASGVAPAGDAGKNPAQQLSGQPLDVVTLSAEAQRLLANAQAPSIGPGSLATYLNTSNSFDGTNPVDSASSDPFSSGYEGAIAQFRQWLSQPLGQPVPYPGDQQVTSGTSSAGSTASGQSSATAPASSTSS